VAGVGDGDLVLGEEGVDVGLRDAREAHGLDVGAAGSVGPSRGRCGGLGLVLLVLFGLFLILDGRLVGTIRIGPGAVLGVGGPLLLGLQLLLLLLPLLLLPGLLLRLAQRLLVGAVAVAVAAGRRLRLLLDLALLDLLFLLLVLLLLLQLRLVGIVAVL